MVREEDMGYYLLMIAILGNASRDESMKLYSHDESDKVFKSIKGRLLEPVDAGALSKREFVELAVRLRGEGHSMAAISRALDAYPSKIKRYISKYEIEEKNG